MHCLAGVGGGGEREGGVGGTFYFNSGNMGQKWPVNTQIILHSWFHIFMAFYMEVYMEVQS